MGVLLDCRVVACNAGIRARHCNRVDTERVDFELRATAFNLLNHQYLGVPGTNIGNVATSFMNWKFNTQGGGQAAGGTAGVCSSAGYCRRLEFTGRLTF